METFGEAISNTMMVLGVVGFIYTTYTDGIVKAYITLTPRKQECWDQMMMLGMKSINQPYQKVFKI